MTSFRAPSQPPPLDVPVNRVIKEVGAALAEGRCIYFLGAGVSVPSGLVQWPELLKILGSDDLGFQLQPTDDLPLIAQYLQNHHVGNRGFLRRLPSALRRKQTGINPYFAALHRTRLKKIWTTNFDTLAEESLSRGRTVRVISDDKDLERDDISAELEIVKVHGCITRSALQDLVLTRDDYHNFERTRPAIAHSLKSDLLFNDCLFLGYSHQDPNIWTALRQAAELTGTCRRHYLIAKLETDPEARARQRHWVTELRRHGIETALVAEYRCIEQALQQIALASRGQTVFITGSHTDDNNALAEAIGQRLGQDADITILDGQSAGVGRSAVNAFGMSSIEHKIDVGKRIRFYSNPYSFDPQLSNRHDLLDDLRTLRRPLLRDARVVVVFDGRMGTELEVQLAREMGCVVIPVPSDTDSHGYARKLAQDEGLLKGLSPEYRSHLEDKEPLTADIVAEEIVRLLR